MIKVDDLSKSFGNHNVVNHLSFEVKKGETCMLLGTSGSGKTTTLKMINGLINPSSGAIFIDKKNIAQQNPAILRRHIGYVLQHYGLFPHYTVAQNIALVPRLLQWNKIDITKRTEELMEKLHLAKEYLHEYPDVLSGGQQQRVGLARALAANPPILLMDEPFGALDAVTRSRIHAEFTELDELKNKTILMVTHDMEEAFLLGDRICLLDQGNIMQHGLPTELLFKPANGFVADFLKGQRIQLAFKTVHLKDLWDFLGDEHQPHQEVETFSYQMDIWTAIEYFTNSRNETINIFNTDKNTSKSARFEQLMNAFHQYKKRIAK